LAPPLVRNGFEHITGLWYLRYDFQKPTAGRARKCHLTYRTYRSADPDAFHQTLLRTYEGTRDCPEVNGVRTLEEIMAGHKSQGIHDPERWWLAEREGKPVGLLLLTETPEWQAWDISYIGVVPEARRQGVGKELARKALAEARQAGATQLTLAVDARNEPAWKLYLGLGFEIFDEREVYLAIWNACPPSPSMGEGREPLS
jgi:mycothiol synthase